MALQYATQLFRGSASLASATLYTVPAAKTAVVMALAITNTAATAATYSLSFAGVEYFSAVPIPANTTHVVDAVRSVLTPTELIIGLASATTVRFHISGVVL